MESKFNKYIREIENALNPWEYNRTEQDERFEKIIHYLSKAQSSCSQIDRNAFDFLDVLSKKEIICLYVIQKVSAGAINEWLANDLHEDLSLLFKELLGVEANAYHKFRDAAAKRFEQDFHDWFAKHYSQHFDAENHDLFADDLIKQAKEA